MNEKEKGHASASVWSFLEAQDNLLFGEKFHLAHLTWVEHPEFLAVPNPR